MPDDRRLRYIRVLPPPVPSHPRERRVVGARVHRVDQRRQGRPAVPRPLPAARARRPGFYDLRAPRDPRRRRPRCAGAPRHRRVLLLPLLVRRPAAARATLRRGACARASPTSPSACAGPTRTGRARGTAKPRRSSSSRRIHADDDLAHIRWLAEVFADPRYLRIDGRPVFLVYRASDARDRASRRQWRAEAHRLGIGELYLCAVQRRPRPTARSGRLRHRCHGRVRAVLRLLRGKRDTKVARSSPAEVSLRSNNQYVQHRIFDYETVMRGQPRSARCRRPRSFPASRRDSTTRPDGRRARRSSPGPHPSSTSDGSAPRSNGSEPSSAQENLLFVNAWNEWAEGNHLEPSRRWQHRYLEAHARASS